MGRTWEGIRVGWEKLQPKFLLSKEMERGLDFGTMHGVKIEL